MNRHDRLCPAPHALVSAPPGGQRHHPEEQVGAAALAGRNRGGGGHTGCNAAWRDPRLAGLAGAGGDDYRVLLVLLVLLVRGHVDWARSMKAFRASRGDWLGWLGEAALERAVVRDSPGPADVARLLGLGVDVLCVEFAELVRDPVAVLDRIAGLCGRPPGGSAPLAAAANPAVAARTHAWRVAGAPNRLGNVLQKVLFPAMAERQERLDRLRPVYLHGMEITSLLAITASVPMALCAPEIVAVLFGPQWDAAVPVLQILAAGAAFHTCNIINIPAIRALGAVYREAWRRALFALLMVFGVWVGVRWGLAGAAAAIVAARILLHLLLTQLALDLLGLRWRRLLRCHAPVLPAIPPAAVGLLEALPRRKDSPWVFPCNDRDSRFSGGGLDRVDQIRGESVERA